MKQAWRWFGPNDPVSLDAIRQASATDIVTALHEIPIGTPWPLEAILQRKELIENDGDGRAPLVWSVVESIPVHDDIKRGADGWQRYAEAFSESLLNLAKTGIETVCYNFMPVIDWTRTDLSHELSNGARALRFDADDFAAFDIHILAREGAGMEWGVEAAKRAQMRFQAMTDNERKRLAQTVTSGLPGRMTKPREFSEFKAALHAFAGVDELALRENLYAFLEQVLPVAEEAGITLAIHPDDPPRRLLGLPRVVCTADDLEALFEAHPSPANGLTLCAGTFGVLPENDLPDMACRFGPRIAFAHLRGTKRDRDNPMSFTEAEHLGSDIDMVALVRNLLLEERTRAQAGHGREIVIRPDHGHQMLDDLYKQVNPGYSAIGRLRGLAEIRGVIHALSWEESPGNDAE
ncbi:MAG: mannonate dehydratase [gamma proteobacterium symbiont of Ctena orbiculata]|uniref:Mannonate dehydratase n=1 Tax=Candidatus Thiodiazotropha taylori TaxID=2792791 RepID=A0A944MFU9_9GAMM|nr:mannonate dehydratase [Candidatus Thiodiazotropha taylori]PUB86099.1 MAG: mannonate dehydratase [gamma proteobacterium symbiont of Ctena orbiculata]MBT2991088.1 mannonate dehydratase [Candidatus Thiodiazotropha taylori]MBT3000614.1 mannonate dehydratase [Candidatus Thiodiazotropha taylori]MBT3026833.1 mannonate dehydratase [Candidatus Thiodiazotropha taylori]